mmetsp:Transcript_4387/g.15414  ORF Transcript_4387/g.15414 Transcript_4387/m.15414 type:complete len:383 (-) Transcript_4387:882-2030(-)
MGRTRRLRDQEHGTPCRRLLNRRCYCAQRQDARLRLERLHSPRLGRALRHSLWHSLWPHSRHYFRRHLPRRPLGRERIGGQDHSSVGPHCHGAPWRPPGPRRRRQLCHLPPEGPHSARDWLGGLHRPRMGSVGRRGQPQARALRPLCRSSLSGLLSGRSEDRDLEQGRYRQGVGRQLWQGGEVPSRPQGLDHWLCVLAGRQQAGDCLVGLQCQDLGRQHLPGAPHPRRPQRRSYWMRVEPERQDARLLLLRWPSPPLGRRRRRGSDDDGGPQLSRERLRVASAGHAYCERERRRHSEALGLCRWHGDRHTPGSLWHCAVGGLLAGQVPDRLRIHRQDCQGVEGERQQAGGRRHVLWPEQRPQPGGDWRPPLCRRRHGSHIFA